MVAGPGVDERAGFAADFVCCFAEIVLKWLANVIFLLANRDDQKTHLVVVVEACVYRAIVAMVALLRSKRHELRVRMHISVGIVALMLAEVGCHAIPAPALVAQAFPPVVIGAASSYVHLYSVSV